MKFPISKIFGSFFAVLFITAFLFFSFIYSRSYFSGNFASDENFDISTSGIRILPSENLNVATSSYDEPVKTAKKIKPNIISKKISEKSIVIESNKAVSSKSFEELINSSVIQLYCGNLNSEKTDFSNIARGTGVIIDINGEILTNRHIVYDENLKKLRQNCFVLKSSFPNDGFQKPKIYYAAKAASYPLKEKFNDYFSKDKYYNDFAILQIDSKPDNDSKISLLLGFDYAISDDYLVLENGPNKYNYLPIDWNYQPKNDDILITLGYGVDATHNANQITSTAGKLSGNINVDKNSNPEIILIESNATAGFSGGAVINPRSKGLVGLISWITSGEEMGKYTVAIFRDFLRTLMLQDLNFDLKLTQIQ